MTHTEDPAGLDTLYRRAKTLLEQEAFDAAATTYRAILALDSEQPRAHNNLGTALEALGDADAALACYRRALELDPEAALLHYNVGHALQSCGRIDDCLYPSRHVIALRTGYPAACFNLSHALLDLGRRAEALEVVEHWLETGPLDERARHLYAALGGSDIPARASDGFVRAVFDRMAPGFDCALAALDYRAPRLVAAALSKHLAGAPQLDILDAGCGTGLVGVELRGSARRLVGVDLSEGMLAQAAARELYDELIAAELGGHLATTPNAWDAIVCADTLVYFGALEAILAAAAGALRPGGWLVFTVESLSDADLDYRLNSTGRYSHHARHVAAAAAAADLEVLTLEAEALRRESGAPVAGLVVCARRPGRT